MILVYTGDSIEARVAQAGEQGLGFSAQHIRKLAHGLVSARRAAVDGCVARGDGLRIGAAAGIAALRALNSRKELFQLIGNGVRRRWEIATAENQQYRQCHGETGQDQGAGNHYRRAKPVKPKKARDMIPAVMSAIGGPRNGAGTSASSSRSRNPLSNVSTIPNPSAAPAP